MAAVVLRMSDWRAVFVMPEAGATAVFLASRGSPPKIAHERMFAPGDDPDGYARDLSTRFGCSIIAPGQALSSGGGAFS